MHEQEGRYTTGDELDAPVARAAGGEEFVFTQDGEPRAVLVGWDRWNDMSTALGQYRRGTCR